MALEIVIPRLGWSMEEGTFVGWLKQEGDFVRRGDPLFELEGEKATQEIEAVDEGILRIPPQAPPRGTTVLVGAVIGYLTAQGEALPGPVATAAVVVKADPKPVAPTSSPPPAGPAARRLARELGVPLVDLRGTGRRGRVLAADVERQASGKPSELAQPASCASPRAKRVAKELGIDWTKLVGSGSTGRVREQDVRAAATNGLGQSMPTNLGTRLPISARRRVIAQRMVASRQQTVPVTLTTKADATNLVNLRQQFKAAGQSKPNGEACLVPSYQDLITKLVAEVLKQHPLLAGRWEEPAIVLPAENEIHIGMAVDTDEGLLVPVIRNVAGLSLAELASQTRTLVAKARAGQLSITEMQGGVFTITNLGAWGIEAFNPVINLPEVAILGLGTIRPEAVVQEDGQIVARQQCSLNLTFDHRVVDGAPAARFLQAIVQAIANPSAWLLK